MIQRLFILCFLIFFQSPVNAQFIGGIEDGYASAKWNNSISIFSGGDTDGYANALYNNSISIFSGGERDGYNSSSFTSPISIFAGGINDGYNKAEYVNSISIFSGGSKDGYAMDSKILCFIWTGTVSTGWNIAGNWLDGIIPDINSKVVIPMGPTNFPVITPGLMSIKQNPNSGQYLCKKITINYGAKMTLRKNTFLENYGTMDVKGDVFDLNLSPGAVKNFSGGHINIFKGGRFILQ